MSRQARGPEWLTEECPRWCAVQHELQDHPSDRRHESAAVVVPVVELSGGEPPPAGPGDVAVAAELVVVLHRRVGASQTWVYVGDGVDQRLELTAESCVRLVGALGAVVAALAEDAR